MAHPIDIEVGKRLKKFRRALHLSQTDVAKKLGISFQQVQKYEIGTNRLAASRLFELCQIFGVTPNEFFHEYEGAENKSTPPITADYSLVAG